MDTLMESGEIQTYTLEQFKEHAEVIEMINVLEENVQKIREKAYEKYSEVLGRYQEQPHLLDNHIPELVSLLFQYIRNPTTDGIVANEAYKYMYQICKVRSYKVFVKFLPHELPDLDFALRSLSEMDINDNSYWEKRYVLLVWMSVLVLIPFHLSRLDGVSKSTKELTKMEQMFQVCKQNTKNNDPCSTVAAFFCAKFLIRHDMKDVYLKQYLDWVCDMHDKNNIGYGQLSAIATILKSGKREDLYPYTSRLLPWITKLGCREGNDFQKYKYYLKIIQRIGLVFLPPRKAAAWRYQRGTRSLAMNLESNAEVKEKSADDPGRKYQEFVQVLFYLKRN